MSIKDLARKLYKHKALFIGIIVASLMASFIYSFFIAVPMYRAQAECEIDGLSTGLSAFGSDNYPRDIEHALFERLDDPQFMEQVSKVLAGDNIQISGSELNKLLVFSKQSDGKSILISSRYQVRKDVPHIANVAAKVFSEYSAQYLREKIKQQLIYIERQIEMGKAKAEEALTQYTAALSGSESISRLQSEVDLNEALLVQLKANMISGNVGMGKSGSELEQDIAKLEKDILSQREKLIDVKLRDKLYSEDMEASLEVYAALKQDHIRLKLVETYLESESNVRVTSYAEEPESSSSPDRKMIMILSLFAGICASVLTVFAVEYFKHQR